MMDNLPSQNFDTSVPTAGQMPQQPMIPQQFPVGNPFLSAAQTLGGFLRGDQNGTPNYPDVSGNSLTNAANLAQLKYLSPEERIKVMTGLAGIMSGHPVWSAALNGATANSFTDALAMLSGPGPKGKVKAPKDIDWQQRYGITETPEVARYLGHDLESRIMTTIRQLEPNGAPVSVNRLRQAMPDVSKTDLDAAAMRLRDNEQAQLSLHHNYANLSPSEQDLMIAGETGRSEYTGAPYQRYYVAIAPRR